MTEGLEPYNVLISRRQSLQAGAEPVQAVVGRDMAYNPNKSAVFKVFLGFAEFIFEPLDHVSRVLTVMEERPVPLVASLSIKTDQLSFGLYPCPWFCFIFISDRFCIVAPIMIRFDLGVV